MEAPIPHEASVSNVQGRPTPQPDRRYIGKDLNTIKDTHEHHDVPLEAG